MSVLTSNSSIVYDTQSSLGYNNYSNSMIISDPNVYNTNVAISDPNIYTNRTTTTTTTVNNQTDYKPYIFIGGSVAFLAILVIVSRSRN